jgi:hypothetical protein
MSLVLNTQRKSEVESHVPRQSPLLGAFSELRKATISFVLSVLLSAWNNSTPTGGIFMKFYIGAFFENLSRNFKCKQNMIRITGILHEDQYTFLNISRSVLLRMKNVSQKSCRENQNTHFTFSNSFPKIVPFMR